jgi:hypothetical protein
MMIGLLAFILVLWSLIGGVSGLAADPLQTTGPNSPVIVGNDNKVIINEIDARALKRLNDELDAKDLTIAQRTAEAEDWARKYRELAQQLTKALSQATAKGEDTTLIKTAQDLLREGKLETPVMIVTRVLRDAPAGNSIGTIAPAGSKVKVLETRRPWIKIQLIGQPDQPVGFVSESSVSVPPPVP